MHELSLAGGIVKLVEDAARASISGASRSCGWRGRRAPASRCGAALRARRGHARHLPGWRGHRDRGASGNAWCLPRHERGRSARAPMPARAAAVTRSRPPRHRAARARPAGPRRLKENRTMCVVAAVPTPPPPGPAGPCRGRCRHRRPALTAGASRVSVPGMSQGARSSWRPTCSARTSASPRPTARTSAIMA